MADEPKRKRGRPRIYPEGYERHHKTGIASTKAGGWKSQKKYRINHADEIREYEKRRRELECSITFRIPSSNKPAFEQLVKQTGMSISALCLDAIREKYGIDFSVPIEPQDENQK